MEGVKVKNEPIRWADWPKELRSLLVTHLGLALGDTAHSALGYLDRNLGVLDRYDLIGFCDPPVLDRGYLGDQIEQCRMAIDRAFVKVPNEEGNSLQRLACKRGHKDLKMLRDGLRELEQRTAEPALEATT